MITTEILIRFIQNNVGSSFLKQQLMTRGIEAKPESAHFRACEIQTSHQRSIIVDICSPPRCRPEEGVTNHGVG